MSLKTKAAKGSMFVGGTTLIMRPLTLIFTVLLTRLLSPEDYGLMALAMILVGVSNLITDLGLGFAVVQSKEPRERVSFPAFLMVMIASVIAAVVIYLWADFFAQLLGGGEELVPILQAMSIVVIIDGLWVIPDGLLKRDLMFKQVALLQIPGKLVFWISALIMALAGLGVWSLVYATILQQLIRTGLTWYYAPGWAWLKPARPEKEVVEGLVRYGVPATGGGILAYFQSHWDDWFVGRQLGTAALGIYHKAYNLTDNMTDFLSAGLFGGVLFPSYAKIQDNPDRLARVYLKSTSMVLFTMGPAAMAIVTLAPQIVPVLLNEKWLAMIPVWQIFSLYALTRPISANTSPLYMATGRPKYNFYSGLLLIGVMIPLVVLLVDRGPAGVAAGVSLAHLIAMLFNVYLVNTFLPGTALKTLTVNIPFLIAMAAMALSIQAVKAPVANLTGGDYNLFNLILLSLFGAAVYLAVIFLLRRSFLTELVELVFSALGSKNSKFARFVPRGLRPSK